MIDQVAATIPAVLLCPSSSSMEQCRRYIETVLECHGRSSRLILGVSDMVTADADWDRLLYLTERITNFAPGVAA